ncbi:MAG: lysophospholipid acyltransferase family protein [Planctomycetota bacterium]|jgi:KDO2-lipid IV(A) lauroyltransferase|nr:lysophospholipid acyltransferase family protein [Planctomycetota bacterium]MDP6761999.1 lysophospholipid acyltransferase family protein [Planctomycetota bacterium]MDP6989789.1 lysophospholipid acyltransferase family protein [Planctomycetota bacterium]
MAEPLRRRLRRRGLEGLTAAAGLLPGPLVLGGLRGLSYLARHTSYERRTLENLDLALGEETSPDERRRLAARIRRHAARQLTEWLHLARGAPPEGPHAARGRWIEEAVDLDDSVDLLDDALARGRGVIIVTAHIGNWELLCARLRRRGHRGAVVGLERPRDSTSRWLARMRLSYGVETLPQRTNPRNLLRVLSDGGVLGLLCDLEVRRLAGEFLPFFSRPALTMTAPAALARAAGLPLLPTRCVVGHGGGYRLSFDEPLEADATLPRAERAGELMGRVNRIFEGWIRQTPEQWAWHQHRWRTQPEELAAIPLAGR